MKKIKALPWETVSKKTEEEEDKNVDKKDVLKGLKKQQKPRYRGYKEDPFVFLTSDDIVWPGIR